MKSVAAPILTGFGVAVALSAAANTAVTESNAPSVHKDTHFVASQVELHDRATHTALTIPLYETFPIGKYRHRGHADISIQTAPNEQCTKGILCSQNDQLTKLSMRVTTDLGTKSIEFPLQWIRRIRYPRTDTLRVYSQHDIRTGLVDRVKLLIKFGTRQQIEPCFEKRKAKTPFIHGEPLSIDDASAHLSMTLYFNGRYKIGIGHPGACESEFHDLPHTNITGTVD